MCSDCSERIGNLIAKVFSWIAGFFIWVLSIGLFEKIFKPIIHGGGFLLFACLFCSFLSILLLIGIIALFYKYVEKDTREKIEYRIWKFVRGVAITITILFLIHCVLYTLSHEFNLTFGGSGDYEDSY